MGDCPDHQRRIRRRSGAFTTFSTFAFETLRLIETGESRLATVNAVGNLAAALAGLGLGLVLGRVLASTG